MTQETRNQLWWMIMKALLVVWAIGTVSILFSECKAQTKNDIIVYSLQFIAGSADGVNQALAFHHLGRGKRFWDFNNSWKNKYKNFPEDKRAAYPLSKTLLVSSTDGYHLTRLIERSCILTSIAFELGNKDELNIKQILKKVIISALANRAGFALWYNIIYSEHY